jgi:molybdenum cofactor cytidylyltransferase
VSRHGVTGRFGVILLAAGRGRRFGGDKRAALLADGRPLLAHTLARYRAVFDAITLVLRADDPTPPFLTEPAGLDGVTLVRCPDADLGMGHSLAAGAAHALQAGWAGAFVALGDMPWVRAETLCLLRDQLTARAAAGGLVIVQPELVQSDQGVPGHPVGFSAALLPALARLSGDTGARPVVAAHAASVVRIAVTDPGVLADVDRPDQLPREVP